MTPFVNVLWPSAAVEAFPQVVGTSGGGTSDLTSNPPVTLPSTLAEGNVLLLTFRSSSDTHSGPDDTGWTEVFNVTITPSTTPYRTSAWRKVIGATQANPVNFLQSGSDRCGYVCHEISGVATSEASYLEASVVNDGASLDPPNLSPSWGSAKTLWLAGLAIAASDNTATNPADYTDQVSGGSAASTAPSRAKVYAARREREAASENPGAWAVSGTYYVPTVATFGVRPA